MLKCVDLATAKSGRPELFAAGAAGAAAGASISSGVAPAATDQYYFGSKTST